MGVALAAGLIVAFAAGWFLCARLLLPLPVCADVVFPLDADTEGVLEYAVRGYRFLKKYGCIRGNFLIVSDSPTPQGRKMAQLYAERADIFLMEREIGQLGPK